MADSTDERDQLIADLLEEAHGLRMKLEDFSQYTEAKVAEFVQARKSLTEERDRALQQSGLATGDLEVLRRRQDDLHLQLVEMTKKMKDLESQVEQLTRQRDRARERVRAIESSRSYRIMSRLRRPFGRRRPPSE
jgi:peptidoglycan hydrolase CwlO-like protein